MDNFPQNEHLPPTSMECLTAKPDLGAEKRIIFMCLFVFRFYGPVNQMGSCRAWSVYLTTRLLGRLSPLSG